MTATTTRSICVQRAVCCRCVCRSGASTSKWGIYLDEQLYLGQNLQPYYRTYRSEEFPNGYGGELYGGESFYGTTENIYNITKIGYDRWFFSNTVRVNCYFAMQYDGTGWGNKQIISVSVRLLKDVALGKK